MAISARKKNQIIAEWKAGKFSSFYAVAKHYKISQPAVKKMLVDISQSNVGAVEAGVQYEIAKKLSKNLVEIKAIESVVEDRIKVSEITNDILDGLKSLIKGGQASKVITESMGDVGSRGAVIEYPLQAEHYEKAMNTVDKASITLNVNQRHAPKIDLTQNQVIAHQVIEAKEPEF